MNEWVVFHRNITLKGEKTEHLITLIPEETLSSIISRINPGSADEIVIKKMDCSYPPNHEAANILEDLLQWHEEQKKIILTSSPTEYKERFNQ